MCCFYHVYRCLNHTTQNFILESRRYSAAMSPCGALAILLELHLLHQICCTDDPCGLLMRSVPVHWQCHAMHLYAVCPCIMSSAGRSSGHDRMNELKPHLKICKQDGEPPGPTLNCRSLFLLEVAHLLSSRSFRMPTIYLFYLVHAYCFVTYIWDM